MKKTTSKLLLTLGLLLFCGCSIMGQRFSETEYNKFVEIKTAVDEAQAECTDDPFVNDQLFFALIPRIAYLTNYTKYIDPKVHEAATIVEKQIRAISDRYRKDKHPSVAYCQIKTKILDAELDKLLTTLGKER